MNSSNNTLCCFFCKRDLSMAQGVHVVAEGPICSMCMAKAGMLVVGKVPQPCSPLQDVHEEPKLKGFK